MKTPAVRTEGREIVWAGLLLSVLVAFFAAPPPLARADVLKVGDAPTPPIAWRTAQAQPGDENAARINPGLPRESDALRERRLQQAQKRAALRDARRQAVEALARRGITPAELRAMSPEERAVILRSLREELGWSRPPGWRLRMAQRRLGAGANLETGPLGRAHVRAQILATDPSPMALQQARARGYRVVRERVLPGLNVRLVVLAAPAGMDAQRALEALRNADPTGAYDLNHVFDPSASSPAQAGATGIVPGRAYDGRGVRIGIVDTGVDVRHPALAGARITQRSFVEAGADRETGHGTAVAALLVGASDGYAGVIPGASLFVADVFGSSGAGGSAEAIAEALAWLDANNVDVINISLEGPPNRTVQAVLQALVRRGRIIVAAVGNEGPTRPVAFPAAYDGVIGVTAIDVDRRVYIAANRGPQVDFSALGVNLLAASDGGYATVSGTSFASPMVAASLASLGKGARDPQARLAALQRQALDLGAPGRDPVYGDGAIELAGAR